MFLPIFAYIYPINQPFMDRQIYDSHGSYGFFHGFSTEVETPFYCWEGNDGGRNWGGGLFFFQIPYQDGEQMILEAIDGLI